MSDEPIIPESDDISADAEAVDEPIGARLAVDDLSAPNVYFETLLPVAKSDEMAERLVAYFGESYLFHDWAITGIELASDGASVKIRLRGCNIDDAGGRMTTAGAGVVFTCVFRDVVWFANELFPRFENAWMIKNYSCDLPRIFQYSEVDSLHEILSSSTKRHAKVPGFVFDDIKEDFGITDFHSILIQHCQPDGMIGIVFRGFEIVPDEPLAWQMIQRDPEYSVPLLTLARLQEIVGDVPRPDC